MRSATTWMATEAPTMMMTGPNTPRLFRIRCPGMGCPASGCDGYELMRNLDFDDPGSYGSGLVDRSWSKAEDGEGWLPVGSHFKRYTSNFNGNDHTVSNLFIYRDAEYVGLFGGLDTSGSIRNVGLIDADVRGRWEVGSLLGINDGIVINSYATGSVSGNERIGGLVGANNDYNGTIIDSYATSNVSGNVLVGGLAGGNWNTIIGSHATGDVSGTNTVGGLVGWNSASISASYATGNVWGSRTIGGLAGNSNTGSVIVWAYAAGNVTGSGDNLVIGGLVGENYGAIRGSYAKGNVLGGWSVGGLVGANYSNGTIVSSYAIGSVSGGGSGGLLGYNSESSVVLGCYALGVVSGTHPAGGLVGANDRPNGVFESYWNIESSGQSRGVARGFKSGVAGKATAELQSPTSYDGIYRNWNTDIDDADGDGQETTGADDPWDFGTRDQYPALRADMDGDGLATSEEFGEQHVAVPPLDTEEPPRSTLPATSQDAPLGSCANGAVVENPQENPGLVNDCEVLSEGRDALAGKATLNWSTDLPIHRWQGITVEGSPPRVAELRLDLASLSGRIPPKFGELSALKVLSFRINNLSGGIPSELGKLSELRYLDVHGNTELRGTIPFELGNLSNLEQLDLNAAGLTGNIPPELSKLTKLKWLDLGQNRLSGSIPVQMSDLPNLEALLLSSNLLSGTIPPELRNLTNLESLNLSRNQLAGTIPPELGQLSNLQSLRLARNELTGQIPKELANLSRLYGLSLRDNQLTGEIPTWLSSLPHMDTIDLGRNSFTGPIPPGLGNLPLLTQLYLFENQLSGTIPPELGSLARLGDFSLRQNNLTGPIPKEFGNLANLQSMDLSHNDLTGVIPPEFGKLSSLQFLALENNRLNGNIPPELGVLPRLQFLHLNNNRLTGSIPADLSAIAELAELHVHGNELTGCIPWYLAERRVLKIRHDRLWKCPPPVAEGGTFSVEASRLLDDDRFTIVAVGDAEFGEVLLVGTTIVYSHDGSETDTDSFRYTAADGTRVFNVPVTVTITPVNDPPVAGADTVLLDEGELLIIEAPSVLSNDTDVEDDALSIVAVGNAINGQVSLDGTRITYEHDGSETTFGKFSYTVTDGADFDTATVEITVTPVNDPPEAVSDTAAVVEGDTLSLEASELLENDADAENDVLSITDVGDAVNGNVSLDGAIIFYKHDGSESITASFSYTVSDGTDTGAATVEIAVTPVNDAPIAVADTASVDEGDTLSLGASALLDNDLDAENDTLTITAVTDATNGTVTLDAGAVIYEHDGSETTEAGFSYTVTDGVSSDTAVVDITVTPVNDPPVAVADAVIVDEGGTLHLEATELLDNDSDTENDTLSITWVGDAINGKVSLEGATVKFEQDGSETTTGSFSYAVSDGEDTDTTTVGVTVRPVNDPPIAANDEASADEGATLYLEAPALLHNDTDAENDMLSITAVGDAVNGNVSLDGATVIYEHDGFETTEASFSYTVSDGEETDNATVKIRVAPVNDPPVAVDDRGTVEEGDTLHVEAPALLYNDTDAEKDTLSITAVGDAVNGNVSMDGTTITYEHDGSETIAGSFSYTVTDGTDTDTALVEITVLPVDDAPVTTDDSVEIPTAAPEPEKEATASPEPRKEATASPAVEPGTPTPQAIVSPAERDRTNMWLIMLVIALSAAVAGGGIAILLTKRNQN